MIAEVRGDRSAPVDAFGAEALTEEGISTADFHYQTLIALMLSSQTKDQVVAACMTRLQGHGLSVANIMKTSDETLHQLLRGPPAVGFHNNKTKFIRKATEMIHEQKGVVPDTLEGLVALPGVGPKMAFIVLNVAFNKPIGIGIDTHVHRMANQLRWTDSKQPEQTRKQLESWLPRPLWGDINLTWVGFGQELQQEPGKLLRKCLASSNPSLALAILETCGMDVQKVAVKHSIELPDFAIPKRPWEPGKGKRSSSSSSSSPSSSG